jgi:phage-related protein
MRRVQLTPECKAYIEENPKEVEKKFNYCLQILMEQKVVHAKLVKRLVGTQFYELRISVRNEHRIILFAVDHLNLVEATRIVLLNGFLKKSTKDYKKAIEIARKLLDKYNLTDDE